MERNLSQADVAEILGMSQQGYSHIENGRAELKIPKLIILCKYIKTHPII
jgi:transcriptional regulator with XRE-family HTH domain